MQWSDGFAQAEWVNRDLDDLYEGRVSSVIPRGFEAYVRVLHPVLIGDGSNKRYVQWCEILQDGEVPVRRATFKQVVAASGNQFLVGDAKPLDGTLPLPTAKALIDRLSRHFSTSELCWFAIWDGFWWQRDAGTVPDEVRLGGRLRLPQREYFLYSGLLEDALAFTPQIEQTPNMWWPETRNWFVATDIDLEWTYVGGPEQLISDLLSDHRLETERAYAGELWSAS